MDSRGKGHHISAFPTVESLLDRNHQSYYALLHIYNKMDNRPFHQNIQSNRQFQTHQQTHIGRTIKNSDNLKFTSIFLHLSGREQTVGIFSDYLRFKFGFMLQEGKKINTFLYMKRNGPLAELLHGPCNNAFWPTERRSIFPNRTAHFVKKMTRKRVQDWGKKVWAESC
eukprot:TRINITY_DN22105_c0_g1_i1.p1 TRINITY_DN22105_c0_g1~~TRINITY_DN22105_c0_g1_i1.p1  ORF type:complete len:169 (+),score=11.77 TRINITY_DN22105_c0_g1_i1:398-904(+)